MRKRGGGSRWEELTKAGGKPESLPFIPFVSTFVSTSFTLSARLAPSVTHKTQGGTGCEREERYSLRDKKAIKENSQSMIET